MWTPAGGPEGASEKSLALEGGEIFEEGFIASCGRDYDSLGRLLEGEAEAADAAPASAEGGSMR